MRKLVVLKLDGDLEQGVRVTLEIGVEGERPSIEVTGQLPSANDLVKAIDHWQSTYRSFGNSSRIKARKVFYRGSMYGSFGNSLRIKAKGVVYGGSIRQWREGCHYGAIELRKCLNNWLLSESFRPIREKWFQQLSPSDEVRVLIRTSSVPLRKLPWHLWDLIEDYRLAEVAFSAPEFEQPPSLKTPTYREKVRILAILGNSTGINVQKDRQLLENLPDAATTFLVEPQRQDINDSLWNQSWDILFFAGHSKSEDDIGRIYINQTDSLTIAELNYALRNAVANGLQLAIFNSCDGLGLALELEQLHVGQMIVMREAVPDEVAQAFLTDFLAALASGKSFYLAEREAREKLHGLEDKFPCASWLPVIFQNPTAVPPSWQDLGRRPTDESSSTAIEEGKSDPRPLYRAIFRYFIILLVGVWIGKIVFDKFVPPTPCNLPATDVSDIDFSEDGKYLATASLDNTVRVLEVKGTSFKEVACQSHEDGVVAVKFSPDRRKIATASLDSTAGLMEITSNGSISSFKALQHTNPFPVVALNFSSDGKYLATASADSMVRLWDTNSRNQIAVLKHKTYVRAVTFSRDGKYLATASLNNKAQVWEWQAHKYDQKAISLPPFDVVDVIFSPTNNNYLTTASANGTTQVWDITSSPKAIAHLDLNTYIMNVSFSPDGKYVATTSSDNKAQVWDWQTHSNDQTVTSLPQDNVVAVAFSPKNWKYIAAASTDGTVQVWTTNGRLEKTFFNKGDPHKNSLVGIAFSPTDDNYLATASADGTVEIRNEDSPNN